MRGYVGAIDCITIQIIKPSSWDTIQPQMFKNRKKFYSISCQAICDADLKFCGAQCAHLGGLTILLLGLVPIYVHILPSTGLVMGFIWLVMIPIPAPPGC